MVLPDNKLEVDQIDPVFEIAFAGLNVPFLPVEADSGLLCRDKIGRPLLFLS
jgi:hypothetical protein